MKPVRAPAAGVEPVAETLGLAEMPPDRWPQLRGISDLQGGSFKARFKRAYRAHSSTAISRLFLSVPD